MLMGGIGSSEAVDYFALDELLTEEERDIRDRVRSFSDREVVPIINGYWEREEFPFELLPKLARGDGELTTFFAVHSGVAMTSIAMLGSEEQKERWLPRLGLGDGEHEPGYLTKVADQMDRLASRAAFLGGCVG